MRSFWKGVKELFTNVWAASVLGLGIAIVALGIAGALLIPPRWAIGPTIVSALCSFIGAAVIVRAVDRFVVHPSTDKEKLAEAERENQEIRAELKRSREKNEELQHRLDVSVNVTKIRPALKLTPCVIDFDITDFYEKELARRQKKGGLPIIGRTREEVEFYRGVYRYSGRLNVSVDLCKIRLVETEDAITIFGPFDYELSEVIDGAGSKGEWLMHGRRELEFREQGKPPRVEVRDYRDPDLETEQAETVRRSLSRPKFFASMQPANDQFVVEFLKLMLAPTGKKIRYSEEAGESLPTKTLEEFVAAYNSRVGKKSLPAAEG